MVWEIAKIGYNLEPARVSFLGYTVLELLVVKTPAIGRLTMGIIGMLMKLLDQEPWSQPSAT